MSTTDLIPLETINAAEVFEGDALQSLLDKIKSYTDGYDLDAETAEGRKSIASLAHKVARSKTAIDNAGKELVADIKKQSKAIDEKRKSARDFLDDLKADVRRPLDEWEAQKKAEEEAERLKAEQEEQRRLAEIEAREREIREREEELQRKEALQRAAERAEQANKERQEREERIRLEAEERAKKEAEERIRQAELDALLAAERERKAAEEAQRREEEAAARAEQERLAAVEAEKQRQREEQEAIQREAESKAADLRHRALVHQEVSAALVESGLSPQVAEQVTNTIAGGLIPHVQITY